ncbi:TPA: PerC family transcriptional regulator [Escherichia coli]|nr:PerC family transcriptional regulator [Escherichia coli]HAW2392796.1 PerC family transcriptional regulator [Escherichia coli]
MEDLIAQKLETARLWRRASSRWLVVMRNVEHTDAQRKWLLLRRNYCLAQVSSSASTSKTDFNKIAKAADATLKRMGTHII